MYTEYVLELSKYAFFLLAVLMTRFQLGLPLKPESSLSR